MIWLIDGALGVVVGLVVVVVVVCSSGVVMVVVVVVVVIYRAVMERGYRRYIPRKSPLVTELVLKA